MQRKEGKVLTKNSDQYTDDTTHISLVTFFTLLQVISFLLGVWFIRVLYLGKTNLASLILKRIPY